ncbi:DUF3011 domain-containing protein [Stenotrophomonas lacuserhaii]|uniref:DUF3011 domain-containing protein n=1 Tax=Stenotrophomonas lacuserhaii TaxID=2760084 RepID=UPI003877A550
MNKLLASTGAGLGALLLWTALLPPAAAQGQGGYAGEVVRCQSRDLGWVHCDMDVEGGVELVRQLSDNACVRGSEWGTDRSGVWVTLGCRAEFRARGGASAAAPGAPGVPAKVVRRVVRCESNGRPQSCPVRLEGAPVRLLRQNSRMPCREGHSWGYRRNEIWTTRGCEGDFEIGAADGSGFVDAPRRLTCESKDRRRRFCGASITSGVNLLKQLSGRACEEGRNWGWDKRGIWVDDGCRAEFSVN